MKRVLFVGIVVLLVLSCGGSNQKHHAAQKKTEVHTVSTSVVNVYYFHGKQRCKTCIAVGDLAKLTIEKEYAGNSNVNFIEVDTSDKANAALVEKYEVAWNALIISKGESSVEITEQAFANAMNNPEILQNLIKKEINAQL